MKIESDRAEVTAGVRHGRTLGSPVALRIVNRDFANWEERMNPGRSTARSRRCTCRVPATPTWPASRSSASPTSATCSSAPARARRPPASAAGALAKGCLRAFGVEVVSHVIQIGSRDGARARTSSAPDDFEGVDESPVRCLDADASDAMVAEIDAARKANESLGGVFEVRAFGLVPGLGSHVSWEERLDGRLAPGDHVDPGDEGRRRSATASTLAGRVGSQAHDEIFWSEERGFFRETNRAGGLEGGMTTGEPLVVRGAMKPLPTLTKPLRSVDIETQGARRRRCASGPTPARCPAAGVVGEAMVALVLAAGLPREVRRRPHRRRAGARSRAYEERIGWRR